MNVANKQKQQEIVLKIETVLVLMSNVKVGYAKKMVFSVLLGISFHFLPSPSPKHFTFNFIFNFVVGLFGPVAMETSSACCWRCRITNIFGFTLGFSFYVCCFSFFGDCGRDVLWVNERSFQVHFSHMIFI